MELVGNARAAIRKVWEPDITHHSPTEWPRIGNQIDAAMISTQFMHRKSQIKESATLVRAYRASRTIQPQQRKKTKV